MEILTILTAFSWFSLSMLSGIIGVSVQQKFRPYVLPFVLFFAVLAFRNISDRKFGLEGTESYAMFLVIYMSHVTCVLCIEQYQLPNKSTTSIEWVRGYKLLSNPRWIGTTRQAADLRSNPTEEIEGESPSDGEDSTSISVDSSKQMRSFFRKPRAVFIRNRLISIFTIYATLQAYNYMFYQVGPKYGVQLEMLDFLPNKLTYFRRISTVSLRETLVRAWLVFYWTFYSVGLYTAFHDFFAILFVGSGVDKPEDWPPMFGSVTEATSIRNFWSRYWHRLVYRSYTSYGVWITKNVLKLPRNSIVGKMFINLYVFAMSGAAHAIAVRQLGFSCGFWEEIRFYCSGFVGILLETLILAAFKKLTGGYKVNATVSKTLGYVWVFTYLFITLPKSQYPKLWCQPTA